MRELQLFLDATRPLCFIRHNKGIARIGANLPEVAERAEVAFYWGDRLR